MTGENLYALRGEKRRWIDEFSKKHGPENIVRVDGKGLTVRILLDEVGVMPFLAEKRLVIVDGVPKSTKEEIQALLSRKQVIETLQADRAQTVYLLEQLVRQTPDGVYLKLIRQTGRKVT